MFAGSIISEKSKIGSAVEIGSGSRLIGDSITLEDGVKIGANVEIVCDTLTIGRASKIGSHTNLKCPNISIAEGCSLSQNLEAEFNQFFLLGRFSAIGKHVVMAGQGFRSGEFLWMKDHIIVGGGGSKGPRSFLTIGDQTTIIDRCYINLSEAVEIGSNCALSMNVCLLTHAAWQPALSGYATKFAGIKIGDYSVVYLNSSIMPGVSIGEHATIGAHSLVTTDIPNNCLAAGVPAKVKKGPSNYPKSLSVDDKIMLVEEILADYVTTLDLKGVKVLSNTLMEDGRLGLSFEKHEINIVFLSRGNKPGGKSKTDILISVGPVPLECGARCHFDLNSLQMAGESFGLAEDLRDYLRRRAIKIVTGKPFTVLPMANLARLSARKKEVSK